MIRKWMAFLLSTGILVTVGFGAFSRADDEKESELEKVMEQVSKHNGIITKGIRNAVNFKKSQKDVEKSAKELAKLAKKARPMKDALKNAKDEKDPQKKWTDLMDSMAKESEKFGEFAGKSDTTYVKAKDSFKAVTKTCTECHEIFKGEGDDKF